MSDALDDMQDADKKPRKGIVVMGMHRSGTSAITGALHAAGAYVGDSGDLTGSSWENPLGFFERQDVRAVCDGLLQSADSDWWKVSRFDVSSIPHDVAKKSRRALRQAIDQLEGQGSPWVVKEPRLCFLLPFLLSISSDPFVVFVFRNPVEVAKSLRRRNGFPIHAGLALWETYNIQALRNVEHLDKVFVDYSSLSMTPKETVSELIRELGHCGFEGLDSAMAESAIDRSLHRENVAPNEMDAFLSPGQKALWEGLQKGSLDVRQPLAGSSLRILREFEADYASYLGLVDERERLARRAEKLTASLEEEKNRRKQKAEEYKSVWEQLQDAQSLFKHKCKELAELAKLYAGVSRQLEKQSDQLEATEGQLADCNRKLRNIQRSSSWRITAPIRIFGSFVRRVLRRRS